MGNGSNERDERGRHSELNHDCVTQRRRATNIFKVMSSFEGSQYQLRHLDSRNWGHFWKIKVYMEHISIQPMLAF
jgi:hypothetical protein